MRRAIVRMMARYGGGRKDRAEELPQERYAGGEVAAEGYEESTEGLGSHRVSTGGGARRKTLVAALAAATLLTAAGVSYAYAKGSPASGEGGGMGSMMGGGGMGSMMDGGMMGGDEMRAMGSFDEKRPLDLQFIDQMIVHHEGAIMSSEHMISDSKRPELRKLAESIQRSQSGQVELMQAMRKDWYPDAKRSFGMMDPTKMDEMMGDRMMGGSMREMMGGDTTDEMFLEMMIPHHQMAVEMSGEALGDAEHPELKDLAQRIEDEQSAEIKLMRGYLDEIEKTDGS